MRFERVGGCGGDQGHDNTGTVAIEQQTRLASKRRTSIAHTMVCDSSHPPTEQPYNYRLGAIARAPVPE